MQKVELNKIITIMEKEKELFAHLLESSNKKMNAIIKREITELENIAKIEMSMALKLGVLEDEREKELKKIAKILNVEANSLDISALCKITGNESISALQSISGEIVSLIKQLKNLNELNEKLLNNSMEYVDFLLNLVTNVPTSADNNYSSDGKLSDVGAPKRIFDLKL